MIISAATRAEIFACKGKMSLSQCAKAHGVSRRSVGRIFHGGELAPMSNDLSAVLESISQLAAKVKELQEECSSLKRRQQLRRMANPQLQLNSFVSSSHNYSSPYRSSPGIELVSLYGFDVRVPYSTEKLKNDATFIAHHPVSPMCTVYPYAGYKAKNDDGSIEPDYKDPPAGVSCTCKLCQKWRSVLAYEDTLLLGLHHAVLDTAIFRARL